MATPSRRDPAMQPLRDVRLALLRLHKALIDSERRVHEAQNGAMTPNQFLSALLEDSFFEWLRPFSGLIVAIDEALAQPDEPLTLAGARAFVEQARQLAGDGADERLGRARQRDPDVLVAHTTLTRAIAPALSAYQAN